MNLLKHLVLSALLICSLSACGDSSSNDQGVSFTFFGWFLIDPDTGTVDQETAVSRGVLNINTSRSFIAAAGLQNNLGGQFLRLGRIYHEYFVPGSSIQIPSTSVSAPGILGESAADVASTLPDGIVSGPVGYVGADIIPAEIAEFIFLNQSQFPSPPFTVVVSSYATAVSNSGDEFRSNNVQIDVIIDSQSPTTSVGGVNTGGGAVGGDGGLGDQIDGDGGVNPDVTPGGNTGGDGNVGGDVAGGDGNVGGNVGGGDGNVGGDVSA